MKPVVYKILVGMLSFFFLLIFSEFFWFYSVLQRDSKIDAADAVVVFGGRHARIEKGFGLANRGYAPFLIVSPASGKYLERLDKAYRRIGSYSYLIENRADTTFQNAVLVADLVQKNDLNSVILVTSDYHMPRSAFFLKLQLLGRGVAVRLFPVENRHFGLNPLGWSDIQKKIVYNEMVKFWGSLVEMGLYSVSGRLPEIGIRQSRTVSWLRSVLLFDVRQS